MKKPNTIAVNVELTRQIPAQRVNIVVEVKGSSFMSGRTALRKAKEVRDIVQALSTVDIGDDQIELSGVRADVASGAISKSSSAHYSLKIKLPNLDILADALGVLMNSKNASVECLDWQYDNMEDTHHEMLREATALAEGRIAVICEGVSHRKLCVHNMTEKLSEKGPDRYFLGAGDALADSRGRFMKRMTKEDLGLDVSHSKAVSLDVRVEYEVEPLSCRTTEWNATSD